MFHFLVVLFQAMKSKVLDSSNFCLLVFHIMSPRISKDNENSSVPPEDHMDEARVTPRV